jgi:hypothetical protein
LRCWSWEARRVEKEHIVKTHTFLLPLIACLAVFLGAPAAHGQYTSRSGIQPGAEGGAAGLGQGFVTAISGESLLMSVDDEDWSALSTNLSLRIGDRLWAQDGAKIEVRFPLGATAWVNYQSELDITRIERGGRGDTIQLGLVSGEAAFDVQRFTRAGSVLQVDTPGVSIRATRAARFRVNTLPDGTAQIGVISGSIVLETPDGLTDVSAGRMAEVQPDRSVVMDLLPPDDEWDTWVRSRAQIYDRPAASVRYLPADLSSYAHEFDTAGRWTTVGAYGSVWVPAVAQGWSPYSNGRWVWQVNDYVWLPFDPWYAPFHFGRWNWAATIGWFWIAPRGGAYWSPGYVGWSVSNDEVSWVPLGHSEVYYGYGNYGPASVNVTNRTTIAITNVYINSRVNNGIVVVKRDNFLRGRIAHERIASPRNQFQKNDAGDSVLIGRPPLKEIKPIRDTRVARPDVEVRRLALPPARLANDAKTIKARVPAPTKERSAFKPGVKPAPLKNVVKEKALEQVKPGRRITTPKNIVAPPPQPREIKDIVAPPPRERVIKGQPPVKQEAPAVHDQDVQAPASKRQFKRVLEPQGAVVAPPAANEGRPPENQGTKGTRDENEKKPAGDDRGRGRDKERQ